MLYLNRIMKYNFSFCKTDVRYNQVNRRSLPYGWGRLFYLSKKWWDKTEDV